MEAPTVIRTMKNIYSLLFDEQAPDEKAPDEKAPDKQAPDEHEAVEEQSSDRLRPGEAIVRYLRERSPEFRRISEIRQQGWDNPEGDAYFKKQRRNADRGDAQTASYFYSLMIKIGEELHRTADAFAIRRRGPSDPGGRASILDMCMAPGGFLATALSENPGAEALAFSLPASAGGHRVLLPRSSAVERRFLDVTMLAADMGAGEIPRDHPDSGNFVPRQLEPGKLFDLVLCDGQVLRTHARASYRESREARRLTTAQLALGLEHLRPGGTMVVLLHKPEAWDTANLLRDFCRFSSVRLVKPTRGHANRSSFYMIAADVRSRHPRAVEAVRGWKAIWKAATLGSDDEYKQAAYPGGAGADELLEAFGSELVSLGTEIWKIQADALEKSSFIQRKR
ncbi:hypothetical protein F4781DRAFT_400104 [Annulohypoxylon bovei var. microspora]|nr:hypothetical protein F4781DRAFT_400104 [Annulohypoxylon bovei var. microspora]